MKHEMRVMGDPSAPLRSPRKLSFLYIVLLIIVVVSLIIILNPFKSKDATGTATNENLETIESSEVVETTEPSEVVETTEPSEVVETTEPSEIVETTEPSEVVETTESSEVGEKSEQTDISSNYIENIHTVKYGECLWMIASYPEVFNDSSKGNLIYIQNRDIIKNPDLIYPGQKLKIKKILGGK